jgi:RNA polymerase sigma-70 factor, ECF subfamily
MIRITTILENEAAVTLRVEGQLTAITSPDLTSTCEAHGTSPSIKLDLAGVTFADRDGAKALVELIARGIKVDSCSSFLEQMLADAAKSDPLVVSDAESRFIARLQAGDTGAFEDLVRKFGGRMLSVARRMLCNEDDAQDAVQEAFASAFQSIDQFNGGALLSTWLHRIVVNCALMQLRRRRRKPEQSIDELLPRFDADGGWAEDLLSTTSSAEAMLESREMRQLVRRSIDLLPETYRTIIILRDIEDLDTAETAQHCGISQNIAKVRLHRARQALRKLIEREAKTACLELPAKLPTETDNATAA